MTASEWVVVDSAGWVEYLSDGPKVADFARYLDKPESVLLPTVIVYEVYKKLSRETSHEVARRFLSGAADFHERLIPLDVPIAELAAQISLERKLPMADAVIYASARQHDVPLITSDSHFKGLPWVTLI
ncbi:MAG: type II toxin-antitoxin system VapC family toxin [Acidobacteria bacterium]|nr:type II toxin-antitoxin system VapC family toxin [Acidobacteriota bacterium]